MTSGVYIGPSVVDGKTVWIVRSTEDQRIVAHGNTINEAVEKYEHLTETEGDEM